MIHNGWFSDPNGKMKQIENHHEFDRVKREQKFAYKEFIHSQFSIQERIEATKPFTGAEMLLWADHGELEFGGIFEGCDDLNKVMQPGTYTIKIMTA